MTSSICPCSVIVYSIFQTVNKFLLFPTKISRIIKLKALTFAFLYLAEIHKKNAYERRIDCMRGELEGILTFNT
jgi:hypothetical protein